ncbi:hypothetical protein [Proteiniborus sp. DW1]|uniref:hypothetical protein n=1 Tax=Proteiniborus sp. DW1 TaxID=1889883 RepID=UPI00117A31E6|nr:hypothetical protein [Proteiniborus sp. DW1]
MRTFERLIIEANHQDAEIPYKEKGSKVTGKKLIQRGERLTSVRDICNWIAWYERGKLKIPNPKTVQEILDWLEANDMIFIYGEKGNRTETHYKIVNYNDYQKKDSEEVTEEKQFGNSSETEKQQSLDTNKNDKECIKNDKNDKEDINTTCVDSEESPPVKYDEDSVYYQAALYLRKKILEFNPKCKVPNDNPKALEKWSDTIRLTIERDKRTIDEMREIMKFVFKDDFWCTVVQSPTNLRKNWDKIWSKMKVSNKPKANNNLSKLEEMFQKALAEEGGFDD